MRAEYIQDMVREGDIVTIRATVLEVKSREIRTTSLHRAEDVLSHERTFRAGDLVRVVSLIPTTNPSRVVHVSGDHAWIDPCRDGDIGYLIRTDALRHVLPGQAVDTSPTFVHR